MKKLNLRGLKLTIIGAALTVCGTADAFALFYIGLVLMIAGLFIGDQIEESKTNDSH